MWQVSIPGWAEPLAHWDGMPRKDTVEGESARLSTEVRPYGCDWIITGPAVLSGHTIVGAREVSTDRLNAWTVTLLYLCTRTARVSLAVWM